jgi:hypothetical protein
MIPLQARRGDTTDKYRVTVLYSHTTIFLVKIDRILPTDTAIKFESSYYIIAHMVIKSGRDSM